MPETDFTFENVSMAAYQETVSRNVAGARLSARLWNLSNGNARNINDVVQGSIRVGQSVTAAGKALLSVSPDVAMVKIPKYIQELKNAADRARALSDNTILTDTVKKYESYINKLTRGLEPAEVRARYAHLGIRGASRMFVKRLQSNTQEVFDSAVDKWVGRKASYQARVVARNETNEAHWLAGQKVAEDKPYVTGFKWNFGSHPRADVCNEIKDKDVGMGPGIYPKGQVPVRPHPNCLLPGQRILMADRTWIPVESIKVGSEVIGHSGKDRKVIATHKNNFTNVATILSLSNGRDIFLTGNHPIYVINHGWIKAKNLKEGDQVLGAELNNSFLMVSSNDYDSPSIFRKINSFFRILFHFFCGIMPSSAINLYADFVGRNSNINIKFANCHLWDERDADYIQYLAHSIFWNRLAAHSLNALGTVQQMLHCLLSSFVSLTNSLANLFTVRFWLPIPEPLMHINKMLSLGFGFGIPNQLLGSGGIAPRKAEFGEIVGDGFSTDAKGLRKGINTFPGQVPLMDDSVINSFSNHALSYNTISVKSSKKMPYSGPVYNLTVDKDQSYWAEGILVHNCNCFLTQQFDDDYFKNYTPSPDLMQQVRDDPRFPEFKSWAMGWLAKTGAGITTMAAISSMAINELRNIAQELGIEDTDSMSKSELTKAINKAREE